MARKKLLTEGEVRQFMKLANLGPLSENYFSNNPLEEEELEDELGATEDELGAEDHFADEEADELDALGDEGGDEDNEALLARVVQAVAAELGVEVDVEGADAEGGEELEVDAELEEPLPGGDELEMGAEEELELPGGRDMYQEEQGADDREDEHLGAEDGAESGKKQSEKDRRKEMRGARRAAGESGDPVPTQEGQEIEEVFGGVTSTRHPSRRTSAVAQLRQDRNRARQKCADGGGEWRDGECHEHGEAAASNPMADLTAEELDHEAIVAEVSRRVAERLNTAKKKDAIADQLAERIFQRLTAK